MQQEVSHARVAWRRDEHVSSQEESDAMHTAEARGPAGALVSGNAPEWGAAVNRPAHKEV